VYYVLYDRKQWYVFLPGWTSSKVLQLIELYEEHISQFSNHLTKKKEAWLKVTNALNSTGGQQFSADEVDKKWRGLRER